MALLFSAIIVYLWVEVSRKAIDMTTREPLHMGNNLIHADEEFADGYHNGYEYYYDMNYQLPRPFMSESIRDFIMKSLSDEDETLDWDVGFVMGWIKAFFENNLDGFYTSVIISESVHETEPLLPMNMSADRLLERVEARESMTFFPLPSQKR